MTQHLIEEAAFAALEAWDAGLFEKEASPQSEAERLLVERHEQMMAMREATSGVR